MEGIVHKGTAFFFKKKNDKKVWKVSVISLFPHLFFHKLCLNSKLSIYHLMIWSLKCITVLTNSPSFQACVMHSFRQCFFHALMFPILRFCAIWTPAKCYRTISTMVGILSPQIYFFLILFPLSNGSSKPRGSSVY